MEFNPSMCNVIPVIHNNQKQVLTSSYFLHGQTLETSTWTSSPAVASQQVPGHHHQQWPLLVHPCWASSLAVASPGPPMLGIITSSGLSWSTHAGHHHQQWPLLVHPCWASSPAVASPGPPMLDIITSSGLSWSTHAEDPCWGCSRKRKMDSGVPTKEFQGVYSKVKSATCHEMVRPTLECASALWCPYNHRDIQLLENVQRRATRYVTNNYTEDHQALLHPCSKIWSGQVSKNEDDRSAWGLQLEINNGLVDINPASFFSH